MNSLASKLDDSRRKIVSVDNFSVETIEAMKLRCEEQGHDAENCCTAMFQVYSRCRWCGEVVS